MECFNQIDGRTWRSGRQRDGLSLPLMPSLRSLLAQLMPPLLPSLPSLLLLITLVLAACSTTHPPAPVVADGAAVVRSAPRPGNAAVPGAANAPPAPVLPAAGSGRGGYYQDDGPGDAPPADLQATPDAEPQVEPYSARGNRPYVVFGKTYTPITDDTPFRQRGIGSWYGKKFHGQKTSSGERYDMYKMTAAHPTLPIPSYARVTNLRTGKQVIVRVNDRGPFHSSRIIDLSYTAALKLGYLSSGSSELEVERLLPADIARLRNDARNAVATTPGAASVPPPAATQTAAAPGAVARSIDDFLAMQAATMPTASVAAPSPAPGALPAAGGAAPGATGAVIQAVTPAPLALADMPSTAPSTLPSTMPSALVSAIPSDSLSVALPGAAGSTVSGFYLQFGAYSRVANAEGSRDRLLQRWPTTVPSPQVVQSGAVYRLYSGPFPSRAEALAAARQVPENPLVVQR